jgi:two-component system response regulator YesN
VYKALVIDDEKPARQAIITLGQWAAAGVTELYEAREGAAGLAVLRKKQPDIVIVDMKMPQMDGVKFLEIACREYPRVKYVVISGYDDYEYTRRAIRANVRDYLLKPVIEAELNEVINRVVDELNEEKHSALEILNREKLLASLENGFTQSGPEKQQSQHSLIAQKDSPLIFGRLRLPVIPARNLLRKRERSC